MSSTYKGDSPGKKVARFRAWLAMMRTARTLYVPYMGTLVLAGEGGDLSVLDGLEVPRETITAADFDSDWLDYCREVYPGINTIHGEVGAGARNVPYNMAHLDFCGGLSAANIKTVADVVVNVNSHPAIVAVTMLKGREHKGADRSEVFEGVSRGARRYALQEAKKYKSEVGVEFLSARRFNPRKILEKAEEWTRRTWSHVQDEEALNVYKKNGDLTPMGTAMLRAIAMQHCVDWLTHCRHRGTDLDVRLKCVSVLGYHSRSKKAHGTPFLTAIYVVHRGSQEADINRLMVEKPDVFKFDSWDTEYSMGLLQPSAAKMAENMPATQVAKLFDVQPKTVVAWRAHASRGTYELPPILRTMAYGPGESVSQDEGFIFTPVRVGERV